MGRKPLDTRERANNLIKTFSENLNKYLQENPEIAKKYTLRKMCEDFSKALNREHIYSSSSMLDILKRNGLVWLNTEKKIVTTTEFEDFNPDDYQIHDRIYQTFISVSNTNRKKQLKHWLEEDTSICEDILAVISVSKGLLVFSDKKYIKSTLKKLLQQK